MKRSSKEISKNVENNRSIIRIANAEGNLIFIYYGQFQNEKPHGKPHGIGKLYNLNKQLFYDGQFQNGKINGIGKIFYQNGELKFEGQFQDGKHHGTGKEYYENGQLRFECQYQNGKLHGTGNQFNRNGHLIFEGQFQNGQFHGTGKKYYEENQQLKYEGEFQNGVPHGIGKLYFKDGQLSYEGMFVNGSNVLSKNLTNNEIKEIENKTCTICLEDLSSGKLTSIMPCNHKFHHECLEPYFKNKRTCPNCRKNFLKI